MDIARQLQNMNSNDFDGSCTIRGTASGLFIRVETTERSQLIYKERNSKQKKLGMQYIWIDFNSVVLIKRDHHQRAKRTVSEKNPQSDQISKSY